MDLHTCCNGNVDELNRLLENEQYLRHIDDIDCDGRTPLVQASIDGYVEIVQILISHGADVNKTSRYGGAPLHYACDGGHLDTVKELIKNGARINGKNGNGETSLHIASADGHSDIVLELFRSAERSNLSIASLVNDRGFDGWTPLHLASKYGHVDVIQLLLVYADISIKNDKRKTASDIAKTDEIRALITQPLPEIKDPGCD
jgi:serine/threonine-protein phosphatase 6 regulatory ankyrin repeat subunit B